MLVARKVCPLTVTVEFANGKVIRREFKTRDDAIAFILSIKGAFHAWLDDGTFAIYRGTNVA